ncbi:hypothetical protein [Marinobacter nauticus]|uniref:hypothetical protein n=1 Tax=Marinobacter nauticus TaxID=2743 RepID=UPI0035153F19
MDMTIRVQDFILPTITDGEVYNHESLNGQTQWSATDDELAFLTHQTKSRPEFEAGGLLFTRSWQ